MSKKTPTKKASAKGNEYVELAKANISSDSQNFYGVIADATFPYKISADRYICSLKVIDPTLNPKSKQDHAQVVLYAKSFTDLPIVHRVGDVIRVNRANFRMYNGVRQFNANIYFKSSWALFSSDKTDCIGNPTPAGPYAFSGKKASFDKKDGDILATLKKWVGGFVAQNNVGDSKNVTLKAASKQTTQFDVCAKILNVFDLDQYTNELKLRDNSGETYYTLALKVKFPHLRSGQSIRIRSAQYDDQSTSKKVLILQHYSNIMTFTSTSKLGATLAKVTDDRAGDKAALKGGSNLRVMMTEVDKKHSALPMTTLEEMYSSSGSANATFRTCFYVSKVEPSNLADACMSYNKTTKKFGPCGKGDHVHRMQFLVKDVSTNHNNNLYRVLLYTHEGLGSNFFGKCSNLHHDKAALKKLGEQVSSLTRFNSWVDAVVERRNGYFFIKDTRMVL